MNKLLLLVSFLALIDIGAIANAEQSVEQQFEENYLAWKQYISQPEVMVYSIAGPRFECPQFQEIVKLGLPALPYIARKMEQDSGAQLLWKAIQEIAKVNIRGEYDCERNMIVFRDFPDMKLGEDVYLYWWKEGRKQTPVRFEKLCEELKELEDKDEKEKAAETIKKIRDLGIVALPYIIREIEKGVTSMVSILPYLTDNAIKENAGAAECVEWWKQNKEKWTIPDSK